MIETNNKSECGCQTKGIAILPVRYTVVPKYLESHTPSWANLSNVTNLSLSEGYQYHVRILREGFLYLYMPDKLGDKWQVYSIDRKGHIIKQFSNLAAKQITDAKQDSQYHCPKLKSDENHATFITLANPEHLNKIYMAFSETKWSEKTLKKYEKKPEKRMQMIDLSQWKGESESATTTNNNNIQSILDFDPNINRDQLPYDENRHLRFSKNNENAQTGVVFNEQFSQGREQHYQFNKKLLDKNSTCEPWSDFSADSSAHLARSMAHYSTTKKPMIIAIEDPIGIATELNGYYNDTYVRVLQYQQERKLEYDALGYIEQAKSLAVMKKYHKDYSFPNHDNVYVKKTMQLGKIHHPDKPMYSTSRGLETLIREQLYGKPGGYDCYKKFHSTLYYNVNGYLSIYEKTVTNELCDRVSQSDISATKGLQDMLVHHYNKTIKDFYSQESALKTKREQDIKEYLKKYEKLVDTRPFEEKHNELIKLAEEKYKNRCKQLITWIQDSNFYTTVYNDIDGNELYSLADENHSDIKKLEENYEKILQESLKLGEINSDELDDLRKINAEGILFVFIINNVIQGLELCEEGKTFLHSMASIDYARPNNENVNGMLWRMLAYHNDDLLSMINQVVDQAQSNENKSHIEKLVDKLTAKLDTLPYAKIALRFKFLQDVILSIDELKRYDRYDHVKEHVTLLKFIKIKIKDFTFGDIITAKITNLLQPIFDKLSHALYSASTAMYKMLSLTIAGISKGTATTYLHLEYQLIAAIISLDQGPNLGTAKTPLYHSRWELRKRGAISKARSLLNDAIVSLDRRLNIIVNRTLSQNKANKFLHFIFKASDAEPGISKNLSTSLKSMRMAAVVAMLELYNYHSLSKIHPNLERNDYFSTLKTSASFALAAASMELMAMVTAVFKGVKSVFYSVGKALSGILGGISAYFMASGARLKAEEEEEKGNYGLSRIIFVSAILQGGIGLFTTMATFSYHFVWCRRFLTNRTVFGIIQFLAKSIGMKKIASMVALRLFLWRFAGLLGLIIMVLDFVVDLLSDDNLETWLKRCALRTNKYLMPHNKIHIYKTPQQQTKAFEKEVLNDMFDINSNQPQVNTKTSDTIDIEEALALIEQDMDERGFLNG
jgi:hypothetical protein